MQKSVGIRLLFNKVPEQIYKPSSVSSSGPPEKAMIIHLGQQLPVASSNLPGNFGRAALIVSLFGLAPNGVYQAFPVTRKTGELLPHLFTLTPKNIGAVYFLWHFP